MLTAALTPSTRFGGTCPGCGRWCTYTPLPRGFAPRLPVMNATCSRCGASAALTADAGQNLRQPLIIARDELDLSALRKHCREHHTAAATKGMPRANRDLAPWHFRQHHRYGCRSHTHGGPYVLVRDARGSTVGQIARPAGWHTGADVTTREETAAAAWRARKDTR